MKGVPFVGLLQLFLLVTVGLVAGILHAVLYIQSLFYPIAIIESKPVEFTNGIAITNKIEEGNIEVTNIGITKIT